MFLSVIKKKIKIMLSRAKKEHLNDALKSKIVTMKSFTQHTNEKIAEECQCSVCVLCYIFLIIIIEIS